MFTISYDDMREILMAEGWTYLDVISMSIEELEYAYYYDEDNFDADYWG